MDATSFGQMFLSDTGWTLARSDSVSGSASGYKNTGVSEVLWFNYPPSQQDIWVSLDHPLTYDIDEQSYLKFCGRVSDSNQVQLTIRFGSIEFSDGSVIENVVLDRGIQSTEWELLNFNLYDWITLKYPFHGIPQKVSGIRIYLKYVGPSGGTSAIYSGEMGYLALYQNQNHFQISPSIIHSREDYSIPLNGVLRIVQVAHNDGVKGSNSLSLAVPTTPPLTTDSLLELQLSLTNNQKGEYCGRVHVTLSFIGGDSQEFYIYPSNSQSLKPAIPLGIWRIVSFPINKAGKQLSGITIALEENLAVEAESQTTLDISFIRIYDPPPQLVDPVSYTSDTIFPSYKKWYPGAPEASVQEANVVGYYFTMLNLDRSGYFILDSYYDPTGISDLEVYVNGQSIGMGDLLYLTQGLTRILVRAVTTRADAFWGLQLYNTMDTQQLSGVGGSEGYLTQFTILGPFYVEKAKDIFSPLEAIIPESISSAGIIAIDEWDSSLQTWRTRSFTGSYFDSNANEQRSLPVIRWAVTDKLAYKTALTSKLF
jgi:hypothetical protein